MSFVKNVYSGIFGQRIKPASFEIVLDKSTYALGEKIKISIDCDNSASSKEIEKIKFELYIGYRAQVKSGQRSYSSSEFEKVIYTKKFRKAEINVGRQDHKFIELEAEVPEVLPFNCLAHYKGRVGITPDEKILARAQQMPPSSKDREFEIYYFARLTIAHDAFYDRDQQSDKFNLTINQFIKQKRRKTTLSRNRSFEKLPQERLQIDQPPQNLRLSMNDIVIAHPVLFGKF